MSDRSRIMGRAGRARKELPSLIKWPGSGLQHPGLLMGSPESVLQVDRRLEVARVPWRPYLISVCDAEKPTGTARKLLFTGPY